MLHYFLSGFTNTEYPLGLYFNYNADLLSYNKFKHK